MNILVNIRNYSFMEKKQKKENTKIQTEEEDREGVAEKIIGARNKHRHFREVLIFDLERYSFKIKSALFGNSASHGLINQHRRKAKSHCAIWSGLRCGKLFIKRFKNRERPDVRYDSQVLISPHSAGVKLHHLPLYVVQTLLP